MLVLAKMKDRPGGHWTGCLDEAIEEYMEHLVKELAEGLRQSLPNPTNT